MTPDATAHLAECEFCRRDVAAARVLLDGLAKLPRPETSRLLTSSIATAIGADKIERRRRSTYRWIITGVLTASILILFGFGTYSSYFSPQPTIVERPAPKRPAPEKMVSPLARGAEDAQKAVESLSRSVAESAKSRINVLAENAMVAITPPPAKDEVDPAAQSLKNAGLSVAHALDPVATSTARAFDFFAREIASVELPKD